MYDFEWHQIHEKNTEYSANRILSIMREIFDLESLLDIGCGDGIWLNAGKKLGFSRCKGVDGPWTQIERLRIPKDDVYIYNLEDKFDLSSRYDLAVSFEVAEHVNKKFADNFVDNLVSHSDLIAFGAAIPYQGGFRHINEQWQSFWASKFAARGYTCFDSIRPQVWNDKNVYFWYKQNILLYVKSDREDLISTLQEYERSQSIIHYPMDLIHPDKYLAIASYDQIAFKPLLKKLPSRLYKKCKSIVLRKN